MAAVKQVRTAVFPVGGLGTRFLPATKSMPKEMLPVVDKPLIQYAFEEARDAGIERFIFITGRNKNAISNHFDHAYEIQDVLDSGKKEEELARVRDWLPAAGQIAFIRQQVPLGLGHAISCARNFVGDEPFAVLLADEMVMEGASLMSRMIEAYNQQDASVIAVAEVAKERVGSYGIVEGFTGSDVFSISRMIEKPSEGVTDSRMAIIGRYILKPEIFDYLASAKRGKNNEIQLTDAMVDMMGKNRFAGINYTGERFDCGSKIGFLEANIAYALSNPELGSRTKDILKKYAAK